ncbi:MAG: hypothetical protein JO131_06550 [Gammaproteobacteria bacterium]|nr:hypothetical protein [Gammaproteobacteria bacterium]
MILGCEYSNEELLKYSSFPIIQDALQEKNPTISFELVRIISEYLDHDIELNARELFVFNEKKNFFNSLKVSGTLSSVITFSLLLFLITTPLSLSNCVKGSVLGGLGFFWILDGVAR